MSVTRWHNFPDAAAVAEEAARRVLEAARQSIESRGVFRVVLAGGSTPELTYRRLAESDADWSGWRIYLGDERCLPADDVARNSRMIDETWLKDSPIAADQVHWIPAERGAEQGADDYQGVIAPILPFDLVMLGMGEDGHTASLFPGHQHAQSRLVVPVRDAPKPPSARISLNFSALSQTRELLLLITGASKCDAVRRWRAGDALPVASLECPAGIDVLIDAAAVDC